MLPHEPWAFPAYSPINTHYIPLPANPKLIDFSLYDTETLRAYLKALVLRLTEEQAGEILGKVVKQ